MTFLGAGMAKKQVDASAIRLDLRTVITLVMVALSAGGLYYGIKFRVDALGEKIVDQQKVIEKLTVTVESQGKMITELSVSLRLYGLTGGVK